MSSPDRRPIVLVGLRGAGKSTVGAELARMARLEFVDLDARIARAAALPDAGRAWLQLGEAGFRDLEQRELARVMDESAARVVAAGGGVVERAANRELLRRQARVLWLVVAPEILARRVEADPNLRPPIAGESPLAEARRMLQRRAAWFQGLDPLVLDAATRNPADLAAAAAALLGLEPLA